MQARMTYTSAEATLGNRASRKLANNTYLERRDDDSIAIRLHATDVVTFQPGTVTLNSGGWRTVTTKERLNRVLPVWSKAGTWYVGGNGDEPIVYDDGITFTDDGDLVTEPVADPSVEAAAMKARIRKFVKLAGDTFEDGMPTPGNGDCWFCLMRTENGVTMGDSAATQEHLLSHLDEDYVVPSLLANAVAERGYIAPGVILNVSQDGTRMGGSSFGRSTVTAALSAYLKRRLVSSQTGARPVGGKVESGWS